MHNVTNSSLEYIINRGWANDNDISEKSPISKVVDGKHFIIFHNDNPQLSFFFNKQ